MGARVSLVSSNTVEVQEIILYNDINRHKRSILESKETKMEIIMITRLQNEKKKYTWKLATSFFMHMTKYNCFNQPDKGVS